MTQKKNYIADVSNYTLINQILYESEFVNKKNVSSAKVSPHCQK